MNPQVKEIKEANPSIVCGFCNRSEVNALMWGPMYQYQGVSTHYFCLLFSAGLNQMGDDEQGIQGFLKKDILKEFERGKKLRCKFCRQPRATVGCSVRKCKASFHYTCGLENAGEFQFIGNYEAYCKVHKDYTEIHLEQDMWNCPLCYEIVRAEDTPLWPPCCKAAVYHRECMMKMAHNSGAHFFKCPLCNDKDVFSAAMKKGGVYLPDRDAAWELEPSAFSDQQQQYARCDMEPCLCPGGREFNSKDKVDTTWRICRCCGCGAAAVHAKCADLSILTYKCPTCSSILADTHTGSDSDSDEEGVGVRVLGNPRRCPPARQSERIRRRYDSSSSADEGPVQNIVELLGGQHVSKECESSECDSDEIEAKCGPWHSVPTGTKNVHIVRQLYGRKEFKMVMEDDDAEESDDDENVEEENEFIVIGAANTVSIVRKSSKDINWSSRFNSFKKRKIMIKVDVKNVLPDARSQLPNKMENFKARLDKLRNLYAQIPNPTAESLETKGLSQVRTGLVDTSNSNEIVGTEGLEYLKSSIDTVRPGPSNRLLRGSAAYPRINNVEKSPEWDAAADKLTEIFKRNLKNSEGLQLTISETGKEKKRRGSKPKRQTKKTTPIIETLISKFREGLQNSSNVSLNQKTVEPTTKVSERTISKCNGVPSNATDIVKNPATGKPGLVISESTIGNDQYKSNIELTGKNDNCESSKTNKSNDSLCSIQLQRSRIREITPQRTTASSTTGSGKNNDTNRNSINKNVDIRSVDDEPIILFSSPPTKLNLRQPTIDSCFSSTKETNQPILDPHESQACTSNEVNDVEQENTERQNDKECIQSPSKNEKPEKAAETAYTVLDQSIIVLSDSEDDDCRVLEPQANVRSYIKSESATANNKAQTGTNIYFHQVDEDEDDDDIQVEVVKLVLKNERLDTADDQPTVFDYNHSDIPVATAYRQIRDGNQDNENSSKYFSGKTCLSKALIANSTEMSKNSKLVKIKCRQPKAGPGFDEEIVILDSSDEEGPLPKSSNRKLKSSNNCGTTKLTYFYNDYFVVSKIPHDYWFNTFQQFLPQIELVNTPMLLSPGGKVSIPNRDENGNTSSKRERGGAWEELESSEIRRSKRPRMAESSMS